MVTTTGLHHIGVQCKNKEQTILFYQKILGLDLVKSFFLDPEISYSIFNILRNVEVLAFQNDAVYIEVFIGDGPYKPDYNHTCIVVENIKNFIAQCESFNVESFSVKKGEKLLWFIKDFSGNLFEIKEER